MSAARRGFTLVEMSIALAVIGLLIGGVFAGSAIIHAARLNHIATSLQQYDSAIRNFQTQYKALPGDMLTATSLWGTASGGCPNGAGTGTQTCNGNGNAYIDNTSSVIYEAVRGWQHLSNAGLINETYSGVQNAGSNLLTFGVNTPKSRLQAVGYSLNSVGTGASSAFCSDLCWGKASYSRISLMAGALGTNAAKADAFRPTDLARLDNKFDDGRPYMGSMQTQQKTACVTATSAPADYAAKTDKSCMLHFIVIPFPLAQN